MSNSTGYVRPLSNRIEGPEHRKRSRWHRPARVGLDLCLGQAESLGRIKSVTHTSRTGKTYYLHTGPKRGGGIQHFFSTKSAGKLAERLPEGFEIYDRVNGQVFLRRQQTKLIGDDEHG